MTTPRKRAPGAGRKPQGARAKVKTSVALDSLLLAALRIEARMRGTPLNRVIETALMVAPRYEAWREARENEANSDARRDDTPAGV